MKILALSDEIVPSIYNSSPLDRYRDVDLILGCGDMPYFYLEYVVTMLNAPLLYVHGNHDSPLQYTADGRTVRGAAGCWDIEDQVVTVRGLRVAGLGGSIRYKFRGAHHQYTQREMQRRLIRLAPRLWFNKLRYGRGADILITHAPPAGIHEGRDHVHKGFRAFVTFMDQFRPRLLLHGHVHIYNRSRQTTRTIYKDTEVLNVYPCRLIEWSEEI